MINLFFWPNLRVEVGRSKGRRCGRYLCIASELPIITLQGKKVRISLLAIAVLMPLRAKNQRNFWSAVKRIQVRTTAYFSTIKNLKPNKSDGTSGFSGSHILSMMETTARLIYLALLFSLITVRGIFPDSFTYTILPILRSAM